MLIEWNPPRNQPSNTFSRDLNNALETAEKNEQSRPLSPNPSDQPGQQSPIKSNHPTRRSLRQSYDAIENIHSETFSDSPTLKSLHDSVMVLQETMIQQNDWIAKFMEALDDNQTCNEKHLSNIEKTVEELKNSIKQISSRSFSQPIQKKSPHHENPQPYKSRAIQQMQPPMQMQPSHLPANQNERFNAKDIGFFDPRLCESYGLGAIITLGQKICYTDVWPFLAQAETVANTKGSHLVRINLHMCLRGRALDWYVDELSPVERSGLQTGNSLDYWKKKLSDRIKISQQAVLPEESYTIENLLQNRSPANFVQAIIRNGNNAGWNTYNSLLWAWSRLTPTLQRDIAQPTSHTTVLEFIKLIESFLPAWKGYYSKHSRNNYHPDWNNYYPGHNYPNQYDTPRNIYQPRSSHSYQRRNQYPSRTDAMSPKQKHTP